jgi:hypothetical protein
LKSTSSGVARNSEDITPVSMPVSCTSARSCRVPEPSRMYPTTSRPITGSRAITEVLIERIRVWLSARFAVSA